jgi:hypothetical protein
MVTKRNPAYTLTGRTTNGQGESLEGLSVRAYDHPITPADALGEEVFTDAEGRYEIGFTGGNIWTPEVWGERSYVMWRGRDPPMGTNHGGFRRVRTRSRSLEY